MIEMDVMMNISKKLGEVINRSTETEIILNREIFIKYAQFYYFYSEKGNEEKEDLIMQVNKR